MLVNLILLVGYLAALTVVISILAVWYARFYQRWEDRVRAEAEEEAAARRHAAILAEIEDGRRQTMAALLHVAHRESPNLIEGTASRIERR